MRIHLTKKTLIICINIIFFISLITCKIVKADCQGCCSWHGGVICKNGITQCADGTSLSQTCQDKGCNVCDDDDDKGGCFIITTEIRSTVSISTSTTLVVNENEENSNKTQTNSMGNSEY